MRRLVLSMVTSLDGYVEGPDGTPPIPDWSPDLDDWSAEARARFDLLIYGRRAWQQMASFWPAAESDIGLAPAMRDMARWMNSVRKLVFSRSGFDAAGWQQSARAESDLADVLNRERQRPGRDMVIFAGIDMARMALGAGVVDEIRLLTLPVLLGGGRRLFADTVPPARLRLADVRQMDTGAILTRHEVAR